jgi:hypothetical protein
MFGQNGCSVEEARSMDEDEFKECMQEQDYSHSPIKEERLNNEQKHNPDDSSDSSDYDPLDLLREKNTPAYE